MGFCNSQSTDCGDYQCGIRVAILGVVTDPTTAGFSDSNRAMCYSKPNDDTIEEAETDTEDTEVGVG